jgi:hypothetical protein
LIADAGRQDAGLFRFVCCRFRHENNSKVCCAIEPLKPISEIK